MTETSETFAKLTPKTKSALLKLTQALGKAGYSTEDTVELAGIIHTKDGEIWDPIKHPRNADGHFVKKHTGVFLLGKNKKGVFKTPGGTDSPYDLGPGDIAYHSKTGNVLIKHPDGSMSMKTTTGNFKKFPLKSGEAYVYQKKIDSGSFTKFDEAPATEVHADSEEQANSALTTQVKVGDTVTKAQMDLLPAGAQIGPANSYEDFYYQKTKDGSWDEFIDGKKEDTWPSSSLVEGQKVKSLGSGTAGTPQKPATDIENEDLAPVQAPATEGAQKTAEAPKKSAVQQAVEDAPDNEIATDLKKQADAKQAEVDADWEKNKVNSGKDLADAPLGTKLNLKNNTTGQITKYEKDEDGYHLISSIDGKKAEKASLSSGSEGKVFEELSGKYQMKLDVPESAQKADEPKPGEVSNADLSGKKVKSVQELEAAPIGSTISVKSDLGSGPSEEVYVKQADGWVYQLKTGDPATWAVPMGVDGFDSVLKDKDFEVTIDVVPDPEPAPAKDEKSGLKVGAVLTKAAQLDSLPIGASIKLDDSYMGSADVYTKKPSGLWALNNGNYGIGSNNFVADLVNEDVQVTLDNLPSVSVDEAKSVTETESFKKANVDPWAAEAEPKTKEEGMPDWEQELMGVGKFAEAQKTPDPLPVGSELMTFKDFDEMPIGSVVDSHIPNLGADQQIVLVKTPDGWKNVKNLEGDYGLLTDQMVGGAPMMKLQVVKVGDGNVSESAPDALPENLNGPAVMGLPVGSQVVWNKGIVVTLEKQTMPSGEDHWVKITGSDQGQMVNDSAIEHASSSFTVIKTGGDAPEKAQEAQKTPSPFQTEAEYASAPEGTQIATKSGNTVWTKTPEGDWIAEGTDNEFATNQEMAGYPGMTLVNLPEKPQAAPTLAPVANPGGKNKLTSNDPNDAPDAMQAMTTVSWDYGDGDVAEISSIADLIGEKGFSHPTSKEYFPLENGDLLLQHKLTPEKFAVMGADGSKKYEINKLGKKYKWGNHIPKSNFKTIFESKKNYGATDEPSLPDINDFLKGNKFTHPESGLTVEIGPDEVLMQHNFTPHSYLVMDKAGNMLYKIDVKGKKQKAGTNLKPSNYFVAKEGKAPKNILLEDAPANLKLFGAPEAANFFYGADSGDFFTATKFGTTNHLVKGDDGVWKNQDGVAWSVHQLTSLLPGPDKDSKSDGGVPLHPTALESFTQDLPVNSKISFTTSDESTVTWTKKTSSGWEMHSTNPAILDLDFSADVLVSMLSNQTSAAKLSATFKEAPKNTKNSHGVPTEYSSEVFTYLNSQLVGSVLNNGLNTWTKTDSGWKSHLDGSVFTSTNLSTSVPEWSDTAKNALNVVPPVKTTNQHGFPLDQAGAEKVLTEAAIGSAFIAPSGKPFTKQSNGEWKSDTSAVGYDSEFLADVISSYTDEQKEKIKLNPVAEVAAKVAAKKAPAKKPVVPVGKASKIFKTEDEFNAYLNPYQGYENWTGNTLFEQIYGGIYAPDSENYSFGWFSGKKKLGAFKPNLDVEKFAKPEVQDFIQDAINNLTEAKNNKGFLSASSKAKTTKTIAKLEQLKLYAITAQQLQAGEIPDSLPDPNFSWGIAKTWTFDVGPLDWSFSKKLPEVKFAKESQTLGFDLFNGTETQYKDYLKTQNVPGWTNYLSGEQTKKYALHTSGAPGYTLDNYTLLQWEKQAAGQKFSHDASEALKAKNGTPFTPADSIKGAQFPPKPQYGVGGTGSASLSDETWAALQFALSDDFPSKDLESIEVPEWAKGDSPLAFIPPNAAKAIAFVSNKPGLSMNAYGAKNVAAYLLKSGIWHDDVLTYDSPEHGKIPLSPGMEVYTGSSNQLLFIPKGAEFKDGDYQTFPSIDYDGDWSNSGFYSDPSNQGWTKVYTAPYKISLADAKKDGHAFDQKPWDDLDAAEGFTAPKKEFSGNDAVALKEILKNHPIAVSDLSAKAQTLILQNPSWADMVVYKDIKGHYRVFDPTQAAAKWEDFVKSADVSTDFDGDTNLDYLLTVKNPTDLVEVTAAVKGWTTKQVGMAMFALGQDYDPDTYLDVVRANLRDAITNFGKQNAEASVSPPANVGVSGSLKQITGFSLPGGMPKKYFADANGDKYMGKHNTAKKFRPDAEHSASSIAGMFGFTVPPTTVREIDGEYMVVSKLLDTSGDISGLHPYEMSDHLLASAMSSHALDWAISNHDTHGSNFLLTPDGDNLIKIDMGQAWKSLGVDKLESGWELPGNFGGVWYNNFYQSVEGTAYAAFYSDVAAKKITQERLDLVTQAVLKKARQISLKNDAEFREHLDFAFKNRTSFPKGMSREEFTELAMARKQGTFDDFLKFYESVYKAGGYNFKWKKEDFESTQLDGSDAHLDLSPDFIDSVKKNGLYGKSLFFAGKEIEDAHAHLYTSKLANGGDNIHADMKIELDGDAKIMAWMKAQGVSVESSSPAVASAQNGLPETDNAWANLIALAKTVSTHAPKGISSQTGKPGDGQYQLSTVNSAKAAKAKVETQLTAIKFSLTNEPLFVANGYGGAPKFQTGHQQQAWIEWAEDILSKFETTLAAMENGEKSPKYTAPATYIAPKGIDISGKPTVVETLEGPNGVKISKYSDWNFVGPDGPMTQSEYEALQTGEGWKTTTAKTEEAPKQESVALAKKKTFVVKKQTAKTMVSGNQKNSVLVLSDSDDNTGGSAYWVTSPDYPGIEIQYEDRSASHANRGRLQWRIKDWDGSQDKVESAFSMMRDMGLSLEAADDKSMELFYWRHMMGALRGRKAAYKGKEKTTVDHFTQGYDASMGDEAELALLKEAFSKSMGADRVAAADWKPRFGEERVLQDGYDGEVTGRPHWIRPDTSIAELKEWSKDRLPSRTFWHSGTDGSDFASMSRVLFSGVQLSNEEKAKFNGSFGTGGSASADRNNGSSRVVYLRQNQTLSGSGVLFEPHVLQRTTNYMSNHDSFGSIAERSTQSPWNAKSQVTSATGGSNEVMIKYSMSAWDDIAVARVDANARKKLLEYYAKKGITEIRGIPVEERIVSTQAQMEATMKKVWEMALAAEKAGLK